MFSLFITQTLWAQFSTYLHQLPIDNPNLLQGFPAGAGRAEVKSPLAFLLMLGPKHFFHTLGPPWTVSPNNDKFPQPAAKAVTQLFCFHKNSKCDVLFQF